MVDDVVLARPAAAEVDDRDPDRPDVDRGHDARRTGLDRPDDRRPRQVTRRRLEQVRRSAEFDDHRTESLGRAATLQRVGRRGSGLRNIGMQPAQDEQLRGQRERDLEQPLVAGIAGQVLDRLAHLDPVAGGPAEHLVHVGQQRDRRQAVADRHLDDRSSEFPGAIQIRELSARAELHVHHERIKSRGELLRQDRADDQRDRLDGCRSVADRVQPAVGGGEASRLPDDRAAGARDHLAQALVVGRHAVAGNRLELVERPAGMAEAPAGDHRHEGPARGQDRREQQAHLVAHAARRVLVQDRPGKPRGGPLEHVSRARHRAGQRDPLAGVHAAPHDRHRQRPDLGVGDAAVGDAANQIGDLIRGQLEAVALSPDQLSYQHGRQRRGGG